MNLEIHKLQVEQRVQAQMNSGRFHDADELIEKAVDALEGDAICLTAQRDRISRARGVAGLASPRRDVDLTPLRLSLTNLRDVSL